MKKCWFVEDERLLSQHLSASKKLREWEREWERERERDKKTDKGGGEIEWEWDSDR